MLDNTVLERILAWSQPRRLGAILALETATRGHHRWKTAPSVEVILSFIRPLFTNQRDVLTPAQIDEMVRRPTISLLDRLVSIIETQKCKLMKLHLMLAKIWIAPVQLDNKSQKTTAEWHHPYLQMVQRFPHGIDVLSYAMIGVSARYLQIQLNGNIVDDDNDETGEDE